MTGRLSHRLVVLGAIPKELRDALEDRYELVDRDTLPKGPAPGFAVAVTTAVTGIDRHVMDALPDLRFIASNGAGLDRIDVAEASRRGIDICYTPDAVTQDTSDFAIALVFAISRRLAESDRFVRSGAWKTQRMAPSRRVTGKRLGVIGVGKIGSAIARKAEALGLDVAYCARSPKDLKYPFFPSPADLAAWCDYLVLACPGGEETRHLVNEAVLNRLGPEGYLINISRGSVVDEAALLRALHGKTIAGAALDVFENEPNIALGFMDLQNVVLTAHIATVTVEARADMASHLRLNIDAFIEAASA